jgi:hypothetical protein
MFFASKGDISIRLDRLTLRRAGDYSGGHWGTVITGPIPVVISRSQINKSN